MNFLNPAGLNTKQIMAIIVAILSVLSGSTAQLTDILGVAGAKITISVASLAMSVLSSILAVITSQSATVKDVLAMPGVQKIDINAHANQTLSAIAIDPKMDKISPTPAALQQVTKTAEGIV